MSSDDDQHMTGTPVDAVEPSAGDSRTGDGKPHRKRPAPTPKPKRSRTGSKALIDTAGPEPGSTVENVKLAIGVIAGTHGVHGELKLKLLTDHPDHLASVSTVYLGDSDRPTRLLGVRFHGEGALIVLDGVSTPEAGKLLGGLKVRIEGSDARPLEQGEYFLFQLIGLDAVSEHGDPIGTVTDMIETGAHDVLVITPGSGPDILVPNHPQYVLEIAPEHKRIVIVLPVYQS